MKKLFALMLVAVIASTSFAQYQSNGSWNNRDRVYDDGRFKKEDNRYTFSARERDMEIARINRSYDQQIRDVQRRAFVSRNKKERLIYQLEEQRRNEIRNVYTRFNDRRNHQYDNGRRY